LKKSALAASLALIVLAVGCSTPDGSTHASDSDPNVEEYLTHMRKDATGQWWEEDGADWVDSLPVESQRRIAERSMLSRDPKMQFVGAALFYRLHDDARGDVAVAELIIQGGDATGFGWSWVHSGKPGEMETRLAGVRQALLARYDQLTPEQRARADSFLHPKE
jgi:hypothetical protein